LALALADDTPLQPQQVMKLVQQKGSPWKLTPDMRLGRTFLKPESGQRLEVAKKLLGDLLASVPRA
jgi:transcription-repair coupling factor (superfamily II helicase)